MIEKQIFANYITLILYQTALSFTFLNLPQTKRQWLKCLFVVVVILFLGVLAYKNFGHEYLKQTAPLVIHLPLLLSLLLIFKKSLLPSLFSLLTAYLLSVPRQWLGDAVMYVIGNPYPVIYYGAQVLFTPILFLLCWWFLAPYMRLVEHEDPHLVRILLITPCAYYIWEFVFTIYSRILYEHPLAIDGMISFFVLLAIIIACKVLHYLEHR